ncbi:MAG TPA: hypothetical protein ENK18_02635 [Deltaproteobacteria bacterium]|nr:hypothetical protein [Deltaproteobacteria bacterium]
MAVSPPRPLFRAGPPPEAPDPAAAALLSSLVALHEAALQRAAGLDQLGAVRFEAYRQASTTWDDPWRIARVADVEEISAELALQRGDLQRAWEDWRAGWWIRRLLDGPGEGGVLRVHADQVMELLRIAMGRGT